MANAAAGETRLHSSVPFLLGSVALLSMAFFLDHNPSAAFVSLLGATIIWGSGGVVYSLPATFLSVGASFWSHSPCMTKRMLSRAHNQRSRDASRLKRRGGSSCVQLPGFQQLPGHAQLRSFACSAVWARW